MVSTLRINSGGNVDGGGVIKASKLDFQDDASILVLKGRSLFSHDATITQAGQFDSPFLVALFMDISS